MANQIFWDVVMLCGAAYMPIDIFMSLRDTKAPMGSGLPAADRQSEPGYFNFVIGFKIFIAAILLFAATGIIGRLLN